MTIRELIYRREAGLENRETFIASIVDLLHDLSDSQLDILALELLNITEVAEDSIDDSVHHTTLYEMYQDARNNYRAGLSTEMDFESDNLGISDEES